MKSIPIFRILAFLIMFFAIFSIASADLSVERQMPQTIQPGEELTVVFKLTPKDITMFDFAELLPEGWEVISWNVQGYDKSMVEFDSRTTGYAGETKEAFHWQFAGPFEGTITLTYTTMVVGEYQKAVAIWTYPGGFDSEEITIAAAVCGNNICETALGENVLNCPGDCRVGGFPVIWIVILITATFVIIIGIAYREYKKVEKGRPFFPVKRIQSMPKKSKPARTKEKPRAAFFEETLKRLEKLRKEMK